MVLTNTSRPPLESNEPFDPASLLSIFSMIGRKSFLTNTLGDRGSPRYLRGKPCIEQPKRVARSVALGADKFIGVIEL